MVLHEVIALLKQRGVYVTPGMIHRAQSYGHLEKPIRGPLGAFEYGPWHVKAIEERWKDGPRSRGRGKKG